MKRILLILSMLLTLTAFAQEQLVRMSTADFDAPATIRESPLYGKRIIVFGDSYVQNAGCPIQETWHYKLAAKYDMEYHNWGRNGNCLAYEWETERFGRPMYERYSELPDSADYVVVIGGHNDAVLMHRYGENTDFFRDKLDILCKGLLAKYPDAKICFITPWAVPRPMYTETVQAMQEVCGSYGIPVFDASTRSGINVRFRGFRRLFFQAPDDVAHLNDKGHDIVLRHIEPFFLGL